MSNELLEKTEFSPTNEFKKIQIEKFGTRYIKYREDWEKALRLELETDFPLYIMLEQTYKCNLRCPSCIQGYTTIKKNYDMNVNVMPMELYERIIREAKENKLASISMHLNDEPLLVSNIEERIKLAKDADIMDIIMTTNGVLLDEYKIDKILEAGITHILFSLDACDEETYNKVRPGGDFKKVIYNINYINSKRNRLFPLIRASFVKSKLNEHQIDAFKEFFKDKVDYIDIQTFSSYSGLNDELKPKNASYNIHNILTCNMPFVRIAIRANGDVLPCCSFYGYDIVVGNVYRNSIKEIWNGELMNTLRNDFRNKIYRFGRCKECMRNVSL